MSSTLARLAARTSNKGKRKGNVLQRAKPKKRKSGGYRYADTLNKLHRRTYKHTGQSHMADYGPNTWMLTNGTPIGPVRSAGGDLPDIPMPGSGGGGGLGGFITNFGKDAFSIIQGLPAMATMLGRDVYGGAHAGAYGYGDKFLTPGFSLPGGAKARRFATESGENLVTAGKAVGQDFYDRYGPLVRGDFGEFGKQVYRHPGFFALDAATVASAGAAGVAKVANVGANIGKAGAAGRLAGLNNIGAVLPAATRSARAIEYMQRGESLTSAARKAGTSAATVRKLWSDVLERGPGNKWRVADGVEDFKDISINLRQAQMTGRTRGAIPRLGIGAPGMWERLGFNPTVQRIANSRGTRARQDPRFRGQNGANKGERVWTHPVDFGMEGVQQSSPITQQLPLLSKSPLVRPVQRRFRGAREAAYQGLGNRGVRPFTAESRYNRAAKRDTRQRRVRQREAENQMLKDMGIQEFERKVTNRRWKGWEEAAIALAARGVNSTERLQQLTKKWGDELDSGQVSEAGVQTAKKQLDHVRQIPEGFMENPTPKVAEAIQASMDFGRRNQRARGALGLNDEATLSLANTRFQEMLFGGSRYNDNLGGFAHPERLGEALKQGTVTGSMDDIVEGIQQMRMNRGQPGALDPKNPATQTASVLFDQGVSPDRMSVAKALADRLIDINDPKSPGRVILNPDGTLSADTAALRKMVKNYDDSLNVESMRVLDDFEFADSVYLPDDPAGFMREKMLWGEGRMGSPMSARMQSKQSRGTLALGGRISLGKDAIPRAVNRTIREWYSKKEMKATIEDMALKVKNADGTKRVLNDAAVYQNLDPQNWYFVDAKALGKLGDILADIDDGAAVPSDIVGAAFRPIGKAEHGTKGYAIPRGVYRELADTMKNPDKVLQAYDTAISAWRAGILAYTPRWYVNNILGTGFMFGVATSADLGSFLRARARNLRKYMPEGSRAAADFEAKHGRRMTRGDVVPAAVEMTHVKHVTGGRQMRHGGIDPSAGRVLRTTQRLFDLNNELEGQWRRAAYLSFARKQVQGEGKGKRKFNFKKLSDDELFEAIANIDDATKARLLKDVERWMGDFKNFSHNERVWARRVFPFYSWLRVINTWVFTLPFRSPVRFEALRVGTTMGNALIEDRSHLPLWERGRINLPGGIALRTTGSNPLWSVAEEVAAIGEPNPLQAGIRALGGWTAPPIQTAVGQWTGVNPFGTREYSHPTGFDGTTQSYGRGPARINNVTGEYSPSRPAMSPPWALGEMLPGMSSIRALASGGDRAFDTAPTAQVIGNRLGLPGSAFSDRNTFQPPPKYARGRETIPGVSALGGFLGAPIYRVNSTAEREQAIRDAIAQLQAQKETRSVRRKEQARRDNR